jgi:hypothetical protein
MVALCDTAPLPTLIFVNQGGAPAGCDGARTGIDDR